MHGYLRLESASGEVEGFVMLKLFGIYTRKGEQAHRLCRTTSSLCLFCVPRRRRRKTVTCQILVMMWTAGKTPWLNHVSCWSGRFLSFEEVSLFVTIHAICWWSHLTLNIPFSPKSDAYLYSFSKYFEGPNRYYTVVGSEDTALRNLGLDLPCTPCSPEQKERVLWILFMWLSTAFLLDQQEIQKRYFCIAEEEPSC